MKTGPVGPVFFGYERILGKPVGQGEHEDDEPDAEGQPGDAGNDPIEIAVVNAPFDQVVIRVLRFGCMIFLLCRYCALIQRLRHPQVDLGNEHHQQHAGDLQGDERQHADENLLQGDILRGHRFEPETGRPEGR